jgi:hypothetical protein
MSRNDEKSPLTYIQKLMCMSNTIWTYFLASDNKIWLEKNAMGISKQGTVHSGYRTSHDSSLELGLVITGTEQIEKSEIC